MSALDNSDLMKYQRTGGHGGLGVKMPHLSTVHLKYLIIKCLKMKEMKNINTQSLKYERGGQGGHSNFNAGNTSCHRPANNVDYFCVLTHNSNLSLIIP